MFCHYGEVATEVAKRFDFQLSSIVEDFKAADLSMLAGENFRIGVIYGPSGSGKTQAIRRLGDLSEPLWESDKVVADYFTTADDAVQFLFAAGLSSIPQMLKPFRILSNGEQYRATLARRLSERDPNAILCIDEFTSVLDRTVAQALCTSLRRHLIENSKIVVATCHEDVIEWLRPCWSVNAADGRLSRHEAIAPPRWKLALGPKIAEWTHG